MTLFERFMARIGFHRADTRVPETEPSIDVSVPPAATVAPTVAPIVAQPPQPLPPPVAPLFQLSVTTDESQFNDKKVLRNEMQWNPEFITFLREQGYQGEDEQELISGFVENVFLIQFLQINNLDYDEFNQIIAEFTHPDYHSRRTHSYQQVNTGGKIVS